MDNEADKPEAKTPKPKDRSQQAAIALVRKKVEAAYGHEPDLTQEARLIKPTAKAKTPSLSKHQDYAKRLMQSEQSPAEVHAAWHEYYMSLSDKEKHEVWQEFYAAHGQRGSYDAYLNAAGRTSPKTRKSLLGVKRVSSGPPVVQKSRRRPAKVHSLMVGLSAGAAAVIIILFSFFNERFIAPFIQPSRTTTNTQLISDSVNAGGEPEIIIPKINVEIPVVYDIDTIDETAVDAGLENGVVHYADTAEPGQNGNLVIVGHSSNNIFNKGHYKFAFVLLSRLENGDTFYLTKNGHRYTYQVYDKKIVKPTDVSVLGSTDKPATASLITCDPPGTSNNRLVVIGEQIDPSPTGNTAAANTPGAVASQTQIIPGNAPTLWSRIWNWISR